MQWDITERILDLVVDKMKFKTRMGHLPVVWPHWASYWESLSLSFHICKADIKCLQYRVAEGLEEIKQECLVHIRNAMHGSCYCHFQTSQNLAKLSGLRGWAVSTMSLGLSKPAGFLSGWAKGRPLQEAVGGRWQLRNIPPCPLPLRDLAVCLYQNVTILRKIMDFTQFSLLLNSGNCFFSFLFTSTGGETSAVTVPRLLHSPL